MNFVSFSHSPKPHLMILLSGVSRPSVRSGIPSSKSAASPAAPMPPPPDSSRALSRKSTAEVSAPERRSRACRENSSSEGSHRHLAFSKSYKLQGRTESPLQQILFLSLGFSFLPLCSFSADMAVNGIKDIKDNVVQSVILSSKTGLRG